MNLKAQIAQNEEKLSKYKKEVEDINDLLRIKNDPKSVEFLLNLRKMDKESAIAIGESKQEILKKQRMAEFELESAEANLRLDKLITEISKWIGKEPMGVTSKIGPLVEAYKAEMVGISQERRNELYFELKGHLNFLTNVYQNK